MSDSEQSLYNLYASTVSVLFDFDIRGDRWQWGENTPLNEFALVGEVEQMNVDIKKAFVYAEETQIDLSGSGKLNRLDGKLTVENLLVALAELFYPLLSANAQQQLTAFNCYAVSLYRRVKAARSLQPRRHRV